MTQPVTPNLSLLSSLMNNGNIQGSPLAPNPGQVPPPTGIKQPPGFLGPPATIGGNPPGFLGPPATNGSPNPNVMPGTLPPQSSGISDPSIQGNPGAGTSGGLMTTAPGINPSTGQPDPNFLGPPDQSGNNPPALIGPPATNGGAGFDPNNPPGSLGWGSLLGNYPGGDFTAPNNVTEQNDPGYQFRLNQGMDALQNSAAARGAILSGGTGKALQRYGQDYASNEYGNVYNRALTEYQQKYNQFQQQQANLFNRLSSLSGGGQTAAGQLNSVGQQGANNAGNIELTSGQQIGNDLQNAGAARASGYVGSANAINGAIGGISNLAMLQQILNSQNSGIV